MEFHKPEHNTFGFYRTHAKDAEGRRVSIKERGVRRNETRLDIINQLQTMTLTQEDAGELAKLLYHYSQENTIADYEGDFELYSVGVAVIEASVPGCDETRPLSDVALKMLTEEVNRVVSASTPWRDLGVEDWQEDDHDTLSDEELVSTQTERVLWAKRDSEQYTADLPSGAVLRVEWSDDDNGWVGRCGSMETNAYWFHGDAQDAIMAWYLDSIERDVAQLRASLP